MSSHFLVTVKRLVFGAGVLVMDASLQSVGASDPTVSASLSGKYLMSVPYVRVEM